MGCLLWDIVGNTFCLRFPIYKERGSKTPDLPPPRQILYKLVDEESPVSKICFCNIIVLRPHAMLSKGSVDAAHHAVRLFNTFPKQFYISWKMHQAFITVGICIDCLKILYVWVPAISGGGNLAASKIRNLECPSYGLKDYGCGKFIRKIHIP